ncbi:hypothetical protein PINS_up005188 [Pythium insidiosum]|nr:hypothetical protein PINS_up005188 [Pythium insidiosum]
MASALPRWNHASCAVLAIPHAKVFVFGGVLGEPNNYNAQGTFMNDLAVLETGDWTWHAPEIRGSPPCGRADTTLAYDDKGSRLLVFGGWANVWLDDLFALDVSCVVGPPYGITAIFPDFGPITGGTSLTIEGIDFVNRPVIVRFASRGGGALDVAGEFVNDHTLRVVTPDFSAHPAGDVQVRVALQGDSFTTTFQTFCFFAVTAAATTFAFGPGVLRGGAAGDATSFVIQARDANRGLRTRGGDEFSVELQSAGDGAPLFLPDLVVQDLQNGRYLVSFTTPKAGEYDVVVTFLGTFGGAAGPIRGSPFRVSFDDAVTREMNVLTGKLVVDQLLSDLQALATSTRECLAGLDTPLADPTWTPEQVTNALIALKEHVFHVEKRGARITTAIDELRVEIDFLRDAGVVVSKESEMIAAVERMWLEIQKRVPAASQRIAPLIATQSVKFRQEMDAYAEELTRKETALRQKPFWAFAVGVKQAQDLIAAERVAFQAEQTVFERKQHIAEILECDDVVAPCQKALHGMQRTLEHVHSLWESIADVTRKIDLSREIPWSMIDGVVLEEEAKAFMTLVKSVHKEIRDCDAFQALRATRARVPQHVSAVPGIAAPVDAAPPLARACEGNRQNLRDPGRQPVT